MPPGTAVAENRAHAALASSYGSLCQKYLEKGEKNEAYSLVHE